MRESVGLFLARRRLRKGELQECARALGKSARTLRNWRRREGRSGSPGRPPHGEEARRRAAEETARVWRELPRGHDGWRTVVAVLRREGLAVPVRLVQAALRSLRRASRARERERVLEQRQHVEVLAKDALWAVDQHQVGRDEHGKTTGQVVRECLAPLCLALSVGPPATGLDTVRLLQGAVEERGCAPFVVQMDNGSENRNADVERYLRKNRIVALWNVPRTPEHNARAERTQGSLRRASGLTASGPSPPEVAVGRETLCVRLMRAWHSMDLGTPRADLDGLTPAELDSLAPPADDVACRARFYADVWEGLQRVALDDESRRAHRLRQREVIWTELERHGLVRRTRGGRPIPTPKAEGES